MNSCDHCGKEAKFLFVCPKCDGKFCTEHRGISHHNCSSLEPLADYDVYEDVKPEVYEDVIPEVYEDVIPDIYEEATPEPVENEAKVEEVEVDKDNIQQEEPLEQNQEEAIEDKCARAHVGFLGHASPIILILTFLTFGILFLNGNLALNLDSSKYVSLEEYMVLQSDYLQLQVEFDELKILKEDLDVQYGLIQDILDQKNEDFILVEDERDNLSNNYEDLLIEKEELVRAHILLISKYEDIYFDSVFWNDYITNQLNIKEIPSTSQIKTWLQFDMTDEAFEYSRNSLDGMAIILSLSAQARNWQVGVISVKGNFTEDIDSLNFCFVQSVEGLLYIDPYLDRVFWYDGNEKITPGKIYDLSLYQDVYVDDTVVIIPG
jgi:hypothetical protein